jgi:hypothetical protein
VELAAQVTMVGTWERERAEGRMGIERRRLKNPDTWDHEMNDIAGLLSG